MASLTVEHSRQCLRDKVYPCETKQSTPSWFSAVSAFDDPMRSDLRLYKSPFAMVPLQQLHLYSLRDLISLVIMVITLVVAPTTWLIVWVFSTPTTYLIYDFSHNNSPPVLNCMYCVTLFSTSLLNSANMRSPTEVTCWTKSGQSCSASQ